ncbi:hypothetical protein OQA88_9596 [Cercophora sp. LCS_1]
MTGPTTLLNMAGPTPTPSAFAPGPGGQNGSQKAGKKPLPHIDDIVNVTPELDPHAPIDKVLQSAETYLNQAEACKNFGKLDWALRDYICAHVVVVDTIKKNKDWVSLRDHHAQYARYQNLVKRIMALDTDFARIKTDIKADNVRSGVQPTISRPTPNGTLPLAQGPAENSAGTSKAKPPVHPKPQALHGNTLASPTKAADDLAQRFAKLRAAPINVGQDPRIVTRPLVPQKNAGYNFTPAQQQPAAASGASSSMPRVPEAIYNPPRGTVSSEAAKLPSSAPRALFTRTNSASSIPSTNKIVETSPSEEYFVPAQSFGGGPPAKRVKYAVSGTRTISVQELVMHMNAARQGKDISILIIDIRSRELFDRGHIKSPATVCLEAEVLRRKDISAAQISDSMVLSPASEQLLFEKRLEFDMLVVYDQHSFTIPSTPTTPDEQAVYGIFNALLKYDFYSGGRKPTPVKLLQGGYSAWTGLVGREATETSSSFPRRTYTTPIAPVGRSFLNKPKSYVVPPLTDANEIKKFEEAVVRMARSKDEFLRGSSSRTPESMVDTPAPSGTAARATAFTFSGPPALPPPIHHRASHSGLPDAHPSSLLAKRVTGATHNRRYRTGLHNPTRTTCFANSSLQAMFATKGFAEDLWSQQWEKHFRNPPRKQTEGANNPQLLTRLLGSFFSMMNLGTQQSIHIGSLGDYIYQIHRKTQTGGNVDTFFGGDQQDAQEFFTFILSNIHDETNMRRDKVALIKSGDYHGDYNIANAISFWEKYSETSSSLIDKYFRHSKANFFRCETCKTTTYHFDIHDFHFLYPQGKGDTRIAELMQQGSKEEEVDYRCEKCKSKRIKSAKLARPSDRYLFCLSRFLHGPSGAKSDTRVQWEINGFNMAPHLAKAKKEGEEPATFAEPMIYDCYAVIMHHGTTIRSGHYTAFVRDDYDKDKWYHMSDATVQPITIDTGTGKTGYSWAPNIFGWPEDSVTPYLVFYKRRDT